MIRLSSVLSKTMKITHSVPKQETQTGKNSIYQGSSINEKTILNQGLHMNLNYTFSRKKHKIDSKL